MKADSAEHLLKTLGAHARAQQAAGTAISSTASEAQAQAGLPENYRAALTNVAGKDRAYEAAMKSLGMNAPAKVAPRKAAWWPAVWKWLVPSLALPAFAAAAFLLWSAPQGVTLPSYVMQAHGVSQMRGEPAASALLVKPGATIEVVLRPAVTVGVRVQAKLYWLHNGELMPWTVRPEVAASGAVRARGTFVPTWPTGSGDELVAFVGPERAMAQFKAADVASPPNGVQVLRQAVTWQD